MEWLKQFKDIDSEEVRMRQDIDIGDTDHAADDADGYELDKADGEHTGADTAVAKAISEIQLKTRKGMAANNKLRRDSIQTGHNNMLNKLLDAQANPDEPSERLDDDVKSLSGGEMDESNGSSVVELHEKRLDDLVMAQLLETLNETQMAGARAQSNQRSGVDLLWAHRGFNNHVPSDDLMKSKEIALELQTKEMLKLDESPNCDKLGTFNGAAKKRQAVLGASKSPQEQLAAQHIERGPDLET